MEGGKIVKLEKAASRRGTDITITDLFYNTPARLKYLKTVHTELGNITDVTNRLALAHPEVSIRLIHNDRKLLHTNGNGDVKQVLAAIYGINIAKKMIPIQATSLDFTLNGYMTLPEITRASRNYVSTMINGRYIKNYPLAKAVLEGYHTLLPIGRYPISLLNIVMDPILVDVNVHPSKLEVRISKEIELNKLVTETIQAVFKTKTLIPSGLVREKVAKEKTEQTILNLDHVPVNSVVHEDDHGSKPFAGENGFRKSLSSDELYRSHSFENSEESVETKKKEVDHFNHLQVQASSRDQKMSSEQLDHKTVQEYRKAGEPELDSLHSEEVEDRPFLSENVPKQEEMNRSSQTIISRVPPLYPIGQMHGTYIFAQNEHGLYIIDQHAAQERIKYEYYKEKVGMVADELQELLVPLTFEYSTDEYVKIDQYRNELEKVGVFLEPFGHNSYIVKAHPQWFPQGEEIEIIEDMIEQLLTMKKVDIKKLREEAAIMMSCKGSIKANRHLRNDEIQALLDELRQTTDPFTCPHGRPILIHTSTYELEKMFKRVM